MTRDFAVGDGRVDGRSIRPFEVTWRATPHDEEGRAGASNQIIETVELITGGDADLLKFTQAWYDTLGAVSFTSVRVADARTLAYRAFHTGAAPGGFGHLDFEGRKVSGFYVEAPEGPTTYFSLFLDEVVYASFAGLLFAGFPLEAGLTGTYPSFGWGGTTNPAMSTQTFVIGASEPVALPGQNSIQAHPVTLERAPGSEVTYWIGDAPPYFVRAEARNANGRRTEFEVVEWSLVPREPDSDG